MYKKKKDKGIWLIHNMQTFYKKALQKTFVHRTFLKF